MIRNDDDHSDDNNNNNNNNNDDNDNEHNDMGGPGRRPASGARRAPYYDYTILQNTIL